MNFKSQTIIIGAAILFFAFQVYAQKPITYSVDVRFFPEEAQMWGNPVSNEAFMTGSSDIELPNIETDEIIFYLHGELKIDSITSGKKAIKFKSKKVLYSSDYSRVGLRTTFKSSDISANRTLNIKYSGFMNPSRARSLSDYMRINKHSGVYLRAFGYSPWFPIFERKEQGDYKANFKKVTVNLPSKFKSVVAGELIKESIIGDRYIAEWRPGLISLFDVQISARKYKTLQKENVFVYYIGDEKIGKRIMDYTQQLRALYFNNLKPVQDSSSLFIIELPEYGNISSQNVVGVSTDVYNNFENNVNSKLTIAHELVHPYVSIPVSTGSPFCALVTEGFPGFFHLYGMKKIKDDVLVLSKYMDQVERSYLAKKRTGKNRRGFDLPTEKPILKIPCSEIGKYKDVFILSDRVKLFLYHLWVQMGDNKYDLFLRELFQLNSIDYSRFERLILKYILNYEDTLHIWLNTSDYPESVRIKTR